MEKMKVETLAPSLLICLAHYQNVNKKKEKKIHYPNRFINYFFTMFHFQEHLILVLPSHNELVDLIGEDSIKNRAEAGELVCPTHNDSGYSTKSNSVSPTNSQQNIHKANKVPIGLRWEFRKEKR